MSINGEMVEMKYSDLECSQALLFNARSKVKNIPPFFGRKREEESMLLATCVVFNISGRIHKSQIIGREQRNW